VTPRIARPLSLHLLEGRTVHQIQIRITVVVVIDPANSAAVDFENIILLLAARDDDRPQSSLLGDIAEMYRLLPGESPEQQQNGRTQTGDGP